MPRRWFPTLRRTPPPATKSEPNYTLNWAPAGIDRARPWSVERAVQDGMERAVWIYKAVDTIANHAADRLLRVRPRSDSSDEPLPPLADHPLYQAMNIKANPSRSPGSSRSGPACSSCSANAESSWNRRSAAAATSCASTSCPRAAPAQSPVRGPTWSATSRPSRRPASCAPSTWSGSDGSATPTPSTPTPASPRWRPPACPPTSTSSPATTTSASSTTTPAPAASSASTATWTTPNSACCAPSSAADRPPQAPGPC